MWVKFPQLPLRYYNASMLKQIVSSFGSYLQADQNTIQYKQPRHARACVEADLAKALPSEVWIGTKIDSGFMQSGL